MLQNLIKIANELDRRGLVQEANFLDLTLKNIVASWVGRERQMGRYQGTSDYGSAMSGSGASSSTPAGSRASSQTSQAAATAEEADVIKNLNEKIANSLANEYSVNKLSSTVKVGDTDYKWSIEKY